MIVRAISIRQPYVELILRGLKKREYRSLPTRLRERVYLYAGQKAADDPKAWRRAGKQPEELQTGLVVGSVEIVDCKWDRERGCYAYVLKNPRRLRSPRRVRNQPQPRFWRPEF